jgi:hypothetical protein
MTDSKGTGEFDAADADPMKNFSSRGLLGGISSMADFFAESTVEFPGT